MKIGLGTRGSRLALAQSTKVAGWLEDLGHQVDVRIIRTIGDQVQDRPFHAIGPPGIFVREIEKALLAGEIDVAVHSYKDLPTLSPDGLTIAAVPERVDPADCLLVKAGTEDPEAGVLPVRRGARLGTSSARREALLRELRPDVEVVPIRGNVPTRVGKLATEELDGILLAAAGLDRLASEAGVAPDDVLRFRLEPERFVPAPAQGALAVQVRAGDLAAAAVAELDDAASRRHVDLERRVLALVEGGCQVALGAWCREVDDALELHGVLEVAGGLRRAARRGRHHESLAEEVAEILPSDREPGSAE